MTGVVGVMASLQSSSVSVSPPTASGVGSTPTVLTNIVTVVTNVTGSLTYVWSYVSGDAAVTKALADGVTMRWSASLPSGTDTTATWSVSVYSSGSFIGSANVEVFIQRL